MGQGWLGTGGRGRVLLATGVHAHAPEHPLVSPQVALDSRVASRVKDLPGLDPEDLGWSHLEQLMGLCGAWGGSSDRIWTDPFNFRLLNLEDLLKRKIFSKIHERRFTEWAAPNSRATLDVRGRGTGIEIYIYARRFSRTKEASGQDAVSQAFIAVSTDCETGIR